MQSPIATMTGPRGLGDLLDGAFRLYRARFSRLVLTAAVFLVPLGVATMLAFGVMMGGFMQFMLSAAEEPTSGEVFSMLGSMGTIFLITLAGYALTLLTWASVTSQVVALVQGEEIGTGAAIRRGLGRALPFLGMIILYGLAVGALVVVFYFIAFVVLMGLVLVFTGLSNLTENAPVFGVAITLLAVLLYLGALVGILVPVGFLSARWIAAPAVIVAERAGPAAALSRSWALTRRNTWRCFGYLVLLLIFNLVVLGLPVAVLQWVMVFLLTPQTAAWFSAVVMGLNYFLSILWTPLMVLALVLLYFDLRVRAESLDLDLRIKQIEDSAPPATVPPATLPPDTLPY